MIAAHDRSNARNPDCVAMYWPRLPRGAAKYSATIAPIVASVVTTLRAVNTNGIALGTRTFRKTDDSDAAYDRMSSSAAGSTLSSPRTVLIITGKNTRPAAIIAFENWESTPNQLLKIGANAMIGIELAAIANGMSEPRTIPERAARTPTTMPPTEPMTRPPTISTSVYTVALASSGRFACHAAAIATGLGR